ncbi:MAG: hypothetical protein U1E65_28355 [Myxococcota bacterium]
MLGSATTAVILLTATATATTTTTTSSSTTSTATAAPPRAWLVAALEVDVLLHDYGLPRHPLTTGKSGLGTILRPTVELRPIPEARFILGAAVRVPMSLRFEDEVGALPIVALELVPLPYTRLRLGSLDILHGFHPAISDEILQRYGRDLSEAYLLPLPNKPPNDARKLGQDPWMPGEHGGSIRVDTPHLAGEVFLDWQLLETADHREKFSVGGLLSARLWILEASLQARVDHYGGERYTRADPIRFAGQDPVRQPMSFAAGLRVEAVRAGPVAIDLLGTALGGKVLDTTAAPAKARYGGELGLDLGLYERVTIGWRGFFAKDVGRFSELGDPIYDQAGAERLKLGLRQTVGPIELVGGLDLVFPHGIHEVQYIFSTAAKLRIEADLLGVEGRCPVAPCRAGPLSDRASPDVQANR